MQIFNSKELRNNYENMSSDIKEGYWNMIAIILRPESDEQERIMAINTLKMILKKD